MKNADFLIVGGSAAGTTAADNIRALLPQASITIVTDEPHEFYSRVMIPHYIRGKVTREHVYLKKPEWYKEKNVELILSQKATTLDPAKKIVKLGNGEEIQYGKLLIAIGGYVVPITVAGVEQANVLYMRTIDDAERIIAESKMAKKALVIGGGFIGLEFSSSFRKNGIEDVKILVIEDFFWQGKIDAESSGVIADVLSKNGVQILTKTAVDHFEDHTSSEGLRGAGTVAVTKTGHRYEADVIGVGIGIRSDLKWLDGTGISIGRAILTNEYLETNLPDVYAAGDCAEFRDIIFERQHIVGNWSNATTQGAAVGRTMAGQKTAYETVSSYSINFFEPPNGGTVSFLGVTDEKFAEQIIVRGSREEGKVTRIFVKNLGGINRIVGATVVDSPMDVAPLSMVIKNKSDVSNYLAQLGKAEFDLKTLIVPA